MSGQIQLFEVPKIEKVKVERNKNADWTGDLGSVFKTLGSSHHTDEDRQKDDYYATDPAAASMLLDLEDFEGPIWEPACGEGHLTKVFLERGYDVVSSDLVSRGFGTPNINFLHPDITHFDGNIVTNPPYKFATEFIKKSLDVIPAGKKIAMFLKVQFMEGKGRKALFVKNPPKVIYISSSRINCAKNGDFKNLRDTGGSAIAYAWFVWEKGYPGPMQLKWFN